MKVIAEQMFVGVMRSYVEATFGKHLLGVIHFGFALAVVGFIFGISFERVILMYLVVKFVWAGCILILFPGAEFSVWQGWHRKDIESHKGSSGLLPSTAISNVTVAVIDFVASYAMSFSMLSPALILTLLFINNGDTICLYTVVGLGVLSLFYGVLSLLILESNDGWRVF